MTSRPNIVIVMCDQLPVVRALNSVQVGAGSMRDL
jgi:hypothetical protein